MRHGLGITLAVAGFALALAGGVKAADNEVVVVPMVYGDGVFAQRSQEPARIRPCFPPNLPVSGGVDKPMVQGFKNNEMVFSQRLVDPRLKLVEDPTPETPSEQLDSVDFTLYLPWTAEFRELRFFATLDQQEPDVVVDLANAIDAYREEGGRDQEAACQHGEQLQAERDSIDLDARIDQALQEAEGGETDN